MPNFEWENWSWCDRCLEGGRRWVVLETPQGWVWGSEDTSDVDSPLVMDTVYHPSRWACIQAAEKSITWHLAVGEGEGVIV